MHHDFRAAQTQQTITFMINTSADKAFPLFGAQREMDWDSDWRPTFLVPVDGRQSEDGAVFVVESEFGESTWVMTRYDAVASVVEYVRVTPEHTVGQIWITIVPATSNESCITVTYRLTGLSAPGNEFVARFANEFPKKASAWRDVINHYLATGRPLGIAYDVQV